MKYLIAILLLAFTATTQINKGLIPVIKCIGDSKSLTKNFLDIINAFIKYSEDHDYDALVYEVFRVAPDTYRDVWVCFFTNFVLEKKIGKKLKKVGKKIGKVGKKIGKGLKKIAPIAIPIVAPHVAPVLTKLPVKVPKIPVKVPKIPIKVPKVPIKVPGIGGKGLNSLIQKNLQKVPQHILNHVKEELKNRGIQKATELCHKKIKNKHVCNNVDKIF